MAVYCSAAASDGGVAGPARHAPAADRDGHRPLLTEPGLGITIDENKLMAQVGEPRE